MSLFDTLLAFGRWLAPTTRDGVRDGAGRALMRGRGRSGARGPDAHEGDEPVDEPAARPVAQYRDTIVNGETSDALVARIRGGDRDALSALYTAFYERLWRFAATLAGAADVAQEVVQDVFMAIWMRHATFVVRDDVAAYLYSAVRHRVYKHDRHAKVVRRTEAEALADPDAAPAVGMVAPSPDALVDADETRRAVHAALAHLPARDRAALLLRWNDGRTYDEIGQALGVSAMGAHKMVARALARVRPLLEPFHDGRR